ncbi:MAG: type 1 glutamine amidotransferase domain-containing protein [Candidatus Caenarcaniphilales bacterium]|nr:type 1 glutamine amidotransferase domain-containing protein [Candidatus Caenarcaniphilales bacterium]
MKKLFVLLLTLILPCLLARAKPNAQSTNLKEKTMNKKILFVLTSHDKKGSTEQSTGFYLSEATHPHKVLTDAGYQVDFVSPKGGEAPMDGKDLKDPINKAFLENKTYLSQVQNTQTPDQIKPEDYAAIYFAGGHGTMWDLPDNTQLASLASKIYENGGIVAAVCHGPAGLVNIKLSNGDYLVKGKEVSAFTNEEEEAVGLTKVVPFLLEDKLKEHGASFSKAPNFQKHVLVSERLVTGQNPASATGVGEEILKLLK